MKTKIMTLAVMLSLAGGLAACNGASDGPSTVSNGRRVGTLQLAENCSQLDGYLATYQSRATQYFKSVPTGSMGGTSGGSTGGTTGGGPIALPTPSGTTSDGNTIPKESAQPSVVQSDIVAKDSRSLLYQSKNRVLRIFRASPKEQIGLLKTIPLDFDPQEMAILEQGNSVYLGVFGSLGTYSTGPMPVSSDVSATSMPYPGIYTPSQSVMALYDVTNLSAPKLLREEKTEGNFLEAHVIPSTGTFLWIENRSLTLGQTTAPVAIPTTQVSSQTASTQTPKVSCQDVFLYQNDSLPADYFPYSLNMTTVSRLNVGEADFKVKTQAVLSSAWNNVISVPNPSTLVLAQNVDTSSVPQTELFRFSLSGEGVSLVSKGALDGQVLNRFSIDEKEGILRVFHNVRPFWGFVPMVSNVGSTTGGTTGGTTTVAVGEPDPNGTSSNTLAEGNYLTLLQSQNGVLSTLKQEGPFAQGEQIYAARFQNDIGYVVTFRQIDPLFVFDLSNKTITPMGQLKIPGVSFHLVSINPQLLLGVGQGEARDSIEATLFDVTDLKNPVVADKKLIASQYASSSLRFEYRTLGTDYLGHFTLPFETYDTAPTSHLALFDVNASAKKIENLRQISKSITYSGASYTRGVLFDQGGIVAAILSNSDLEIFATNPVTSLYSAPSSSVLQAGQAIWNPETLVFELSYRSGFSPTRLFEDYSYARQTHTLSVQRDKTNSMTGVSSTEQKTLVLSAAAQSQLEGLLAQLKISAPVSAPCAQDLDSYRVRTVDQAGNAVTLIDSMNAACVGGFSVDRAQLEQVDNLMNQLLQ